VGNGVLAEVLAFWQTEYHLPKDVKVCSYRKPSVCGSRAAHHFYCTVANEIAMMVAIRQTAVVRIDRTRQSFGARYTQTEAWISSKERIVVTA